ncbi:hypothetical protein ACJJTC_002136 [Scirpophaga incertulas]
MTILQGILRSILLYVSNVPNVTCCKMLYNKVRGASGDACGSVANRMLYVQQFTPGTSIAHMSKCYFSPKITCDYEISNINSTASIPSTSHPSPDYSIKHLDNDCSNHFCPYYIGKENELPFEAATYNNSPAFQSESSTPQANTLLSCFSNDSPQPQSIIRFRKDGGNVRKRHVKDWLDVKGKKLSEILVSNM